MILRRLVEHVRTQNWTAIALDFVIVVAGVFMGIQLGNWNDARAARAEGARYISQLAREYAVIGENIEGQVASYTEFSKAAQQALVLLAADQAPTSGELTPLLESALGGRIPPREPSALRELISAGKLDLIRQDELRAELMQAQGDAELVSRAFDLLRADLLELSHDLVRYVDFDLSSDLTDPALGVEAQRIASVDVAGLRNDPDAIVAIKTYLAAQLNMLALERFYLQRIRRVNDMLAAIQEDNP